ncbi:MFS transporter [Novacetimonas pomaceti]|uniref:Alpha-ketoglutarate transporter n=1 Tax=Novacetimonas pomaceti TaxID=2021998 RepID=A0ABX5P1E3_9PROT|nr:MFS transporter [Novacetimonas pomaceti]PYD47590.1 alpha-ketoglutarate transporter [Novacetimonas pomaceti]
MHIPPSPDVTLTTRQRIRSIVAGSSGNLIEYYDWYVYAAFSLYFAHAFFPHGSQTAELLRTAAIFAIGFLMRPIGGWVMGLVADRHGRRFALSISVLAMCAGSLTIALCPGYDSIGIAAPAILLLARLVQGLSLGGEYGASATYLSEIAPPAQRGFYASFQYVTLVAGQLLALVVLLLLQFVILTPQQLGAWGWRVPFGIGALLALSVLWFRRGMAESEQFRNATRDPGAAGGLRVLLRHPREVISVCGLTLGGTVAFYTFTIYMQKYLVNTTGLSREQSTVVSTTALAIFALAQPAFGALSDRVGRRPLLLSFGVIGCIVTVPLMHALGQAHSPRMALLLVVVALLCISGYTSINAVVKAELFPTRIRALGVALPYALTVSIFGGTAEYVALWFKEAGHEEWFYWYVTGCIACSLLTVLFLLPARDSITSGTQEGV